jgi:hypothetical protein
VRPRASVRRRRPFQLFAALLAVLVVMAGMTGLFTGFQLSQQAATLETSLSDEVTLGAGEAQKGKDLVSRANAENNPLLLNEAKQHFERSRGHFQSADDMVAHNPLLLAMMVLPGPGQSYAAPRLSSVRGIAGMGMALADAGKDAADVDAQLLRPGGSKEQHGGQRLVALLKAAQAGVSRIKTDLQRAGQQAAVVDTSLLTSSQQASFKAARDSIAKGLDGVKEFERLTPVLLEIMGENGPRSYLVQQLDPAELRAGGGFIGSFTTLNANKGDLNLGPGVNVWDIDFPYPTPANSKPPGQLTQAFDHGLVFGDSNYLPDFAQSAAVGMATFKRQTGQKVDGVVSIDPWVVAAFLEVTGPIDVPEYGTKVEASTFPEDVFQRLEKANANTPDKKQFFPVVAAKVIDRVLNLEADKWPALITSLNNAVTQRHLQVYMVNKSVQDEMNHLGWSGTLAPPKPNQELLAEVECNYGGNKANHFLQRSYDLTLTADQGKLRHRVVINLVNRTPTGYLGGRHYTFYLRLYVPATATETKVTGLIPDRFPADENLTGLKLLDGWYEVQVSNPRGTGTHQVILEYTTNAPDLAGGHEIYWRKQAGTGPDRVKVTYKVGGRTLTADTDLAQDRILLVSNDALQVKPGATGGAKLPVIGA